MVNGMTSTSMTKIKAEKAGVAAFNEGRKMAPALNGAFLRAACASGNTSEMLTAYIHGWTVAMLADRAPVGTPSVGELERICTA